MFPLLAVVQSLRELAPETEFFWFGSRRLEWDVVSRYGIDGLFIPYTFSYRRMNLASAAYYLRTVPAWISGRPFFAALRTIDRFQPDTVLSSGGYVSLPALTAATVRHIPTFLVETNAVPGRVNSIFAPFACRVYCATLQIAERLRRSASPGSVVCSGYPARKPGAVDPYAYFEIAPCELPIVVISGGSTGAEFLNELFLRAVMTPGFGDEFSQRIMFVHQWGRAPAEREIARFILLQHYHALSFDPFISEFYPLSTLFVGRAGASTIGELIEAKLPAVLVPYPYHSDRQQYANAALLADAGCAVVREQVELTPQDFIELLRKLVVDRGAERMREGYKAMRTGGAEVIAQDILAFGGSTL